MKDAIQDSVRVDVKATTSCKRVKPKVLKESSLAAGLAAFEALESVEGATRPVVITARTLVEQGIESIMRSRARGVPLLRIYNDVKKAAGLRIGFPTFAGYVSEISAKKGLRQAKAKAEAGAQPRPQPEAPTATGEWGCAECVSTARRLEKDGRAWWQCPACKAFYADDDGKLSTKRLTAKKSEEA